MKEQGAIRFTCQDIADYKKVTVHAVYAAIKRGVLDTSSLSSIIDYCCGRNVLKLNGDSNFSTSESDVLKLKQERREIFNRDLKRDLDDREDDYKVIHKDDW